jgi:hypothetical protein
MILQVERSVSAFSNTPVLQCFNTPKAFLIITGEDIETPLGQVKQIFYNLIIVFPDGTRQYLISPKERKASPFK